ncbi:MAG: aa3-type cytochrome c oxidase subunit IV [Hyphomicrobiaceae bacterium]|nr:aa3-type cytochrome c oxidase subunit IV [Hyphomicrobiaceae bacterium]
MSIDTSGGHPEMDYKEHVRTYSGFVALIKWSTIAIVLLMAILAVTIV